MAELYNIYLDTGGTFSDAIILKNDGTFVTGKASTTPNDLSECFINCIQAACDKLDKPIEEILSKTQILGFGTTAGTNAILTRVGGPHLGLICTKGFEDTTIIMKAAGRWDGLGMQAMHIAAGDNPLPLVPRYLIKGVTERVDSLGGVAIPLHEDEVRKAVEELLAEGVEGIAVATLWSFLNDAHEERIKEIIEEMAPNLLVAISCEITPLVREYARFNSTILNLYIEGPLKVLFSRIKDKLKSLGYKNPLLVMQAAGGLSRSEVIQPIATLHSGPIGGLMGVKFFMDLYGFKNAGGSDVGGTSFDISIVSKEQGLHYVREPVVNQLRLKNPMLEVEVIGSGGGTIAYIDELTGRLRVGPQSAGSTPGPVCYDLGGTEPTITDCDVIMNRIDPKYFLGGKMSLKKDKAYAAVKEKIADPLGLGVEEAAQAICTIADQRMGSVLGRLIRERGLAVEEFALFSFGGAGAAHCMGYSYLSNLNFMKVIVCPFAATFSAFGASTADVLHRYETSPFLIIPKLPFDVHKRTFQVSSLDAIPEGVVERYNQSFEAFEKRGIEQMEGEGFRADDLHYRASVEMRYGGQLWEGIFNAPVRRINTVDDLNAVIRSFEEEYERRYTRLGMYPEGGLEIITLTLEVYAVTPKPMLAKRPLQGEDPSAALKWGRKVFFNDEWLDSNVYEMEALNAGNVVMGPSIIEATDTTLVLPKGFKAVRDEYMNFVLTPADR